MAFMGLVQSSSRPIEEIKEIKEEAEEVCLLEVSCLCPSPYRSDTLVGRAQNCRKTVEKLSKTHTATLHICGGLHKHTDLPWHV